MAKPRKMTPEEEVERDKRERDSYELLKKRQARDEELARERKRRAAS